MKPGQPERRISCLRSAGPFYNHNVKTVKREITPKRVRESKNLFKAPHSILELKRNNINQSLIGKNELPRLSKSFAGGINKRVLQTRSTFRRPSINVLAARKTMLERALKLGESYNSNEVKKELDIQTTVNKALSVTHTPKQSGLAKAYLKLSESMKKSNQTKRSVTIPAPPISPFEEEHLRQRNNKQNSVSGKNNHCMEKNPEIIVTDERETKISTNSNIVVNGEQKDDITLVDSLVCRKDVSQKISASYDNPNSVAEKIESFNFNEESSCPLRNILQISHDYSMKMSKININLQNLDEYFSKIMVAEIGGDIYNKFLEYQKKKQCLYKEMEGIEKELEIAIKNELNIQSKFQEYMEKKNNILKERMNLQKFFEETVNDILQKYEKRVIESFNFSKFDENVRTPSTNILIMSSPQNGIEKMPVKEEEPVLRRSKRLLRTPITETPKNPIQSRSDSVNNSEEKEAFVVRRSRRMLDKKQLQYSIYKDLQRSFNLCSPDSSFN